MDTEALKKSLLKKFQEVTADRLQKIQLGVIDLEKPTAAQAAEDVARELHTMKGEARMLGLPAIGHLAHAAEDLLRSEREGKTATRLATDLLLRACDTLSDLIDDLAVAQTGGPDVDEMCRALSAASGHALPAGAPGTQRAPAPAVSPPPQAVSEAVRPGEHTLPPAAHFTPEPERAPAGNPACSPATCWWTARARACGPRSSTGCCSATPAWATASCASPSRSTRPASCARSSTASRAISTCCVTTRSASPAATAMAWRRCTATSRS